MRRISTWLTAILATSACGDDGGPPVDAPDVDAAAVDAPTDAPAIDAPTDAPAIDACATQTLLAGGTDPVAQGWTVTQQGPASLTLSSATTTQLATSTVGTTSGQLLLSLPGAVTPPFAIEVRLQVLAVSPHNQFDAAVAILGSFTPPVGLSAERSQMIYVDGARLGFADNIGQFAANALDGQFHTYRLEVDAAGNAMFYRDGTPALERANFTTNGTIAIGDQTNDPNVDATILVESVTKLCR